MQLTEPMTLATDFVLGALCLVLWARLRARCRDGDRGSARLFAGSLMATAVAAFAGGASHGFRLHLGPAAAILLWKVTVLAIGVTSLLFLLASARAALADPWRRIVNAAAWIEFVAYGAWMLGHDEFIWVISDYVPAMVVVLGLQGLQALRGAPEPRWIVPGILLSFVGAGIQATGLAPAPWFNHNDLYHVVQMVAVWFLYRGALVMRDRSA